MYCGSKVTCFAAFTFLRALLRTHHNLHADVKERVAFSMCDFFLDWSVEKIDLCHIGMAASEP
jgi:hypothetical protein